MRRPQSNCFIERLHRALLDEHVRIKGSTTKFESEELMQTDLDSHPEHYTVINFAVTQNYLQNHQKHQVKFICIYFSMCKVFYLAF